jgi:hypothetical protein
MNVKRKKNTVDSVRAGSLFIKSFTNASLTEFGKVATNQPEHEKY